MPKNALKMLLGLVYLCLGLLPIIRCELRLEISEYKDFGPTQQVNATVELLAGTNFQLACTIRGDGNFSNPSIRWGRKTKDLKFKTESDLASLARQRYRPLLDLQNLSESSDHPFTYETDKVVRSFKPIKVTDRGIYFCMSLKYMLFKVVQIKVKELYLDLGMVNVKCSEYWFQCVSNGFCISSHYKCDGKRDCKDGSDEDWDMCDGPPCRDKIRCSNGRCIPQSWCCDKRTDDNCNHTIRHDCCPPLENPYEPWYTGQNVTKIEGTSVGSKYLFITICVVSALLSFVLFLFVISKMCGFDGMPSRRSVSLPPLICDHSECVLRRQFSANTMCLYQQDVNVVTSDNNNDLGDPLIMINAERASDQPPSYSEVINTPPNMDKLTLDLLDVPPPPYSSTNRDPTDQSQNCDTSGDSNNLAT